MGRTRSPTPDPFSRGVNAMRRATSAFLSSRAARLGVLTVPLVAAAALTGVLLSGCKSSGSQADYDLDSGVDDAPDAAGPAAPPDTETATESEAAVPDGELNFNVGEP